MSFYEFVDLVNAARQHLRTCDGGEAEGLPCEECAEAQDIMDEYRRASARRDQ